MSIKTTLVTVLTLALLGLGAGYAVAGDGEADSEYPAPNRAAKEGAGEEGGLAADAAMAAQLVQWARANGSPEGLIAAAQIAAATQSQEAEVEKAAEGGEEGEEGDGTAPTLDADALLAEADALAKSSGARHLGKHVKALQSAGLSAGTRGDVTGPNRHYDRVLSNSTDVYTITFKGGALAEVGISGDGDTDLDLFVYDEYGNLIESSTSTGDDEYVSWYPRWTGKFTIRVKNLGRVYNNYVILTN